MLQRPSADELSKSKWVKAAKAPISVLKDLITQYDAWHQAGGTRASIADPLSWEEEEEARFVVTTFMCSVCLTNSSTA